MDLTEDLLSLPPRQIPPPHLEILFSRIILFEDSHARFRPLSQEPVLPLLFQFLFFSPRSLVLTRNIVQLGLRPSTHQLRSSYVVYCLAKICLLSSPSNTQPPKNFK